MPKFQVTSPEGKSYEITAPEGATQDQVLSYAKSQFGASATPPGQQDTSSKEAFLKSGLPPPLSDSAGDFPGSDYIGQLEAAGSVGSAILGGLVGPVAGVGRRLFGGTAREAEKTAADVGRAVYYEPRTPKGRGNMEALRGEINLPFGLGRDSPMRLISGMGPPEQMMLAGAAKPSVNIPMRRSIKGEIAPPPMVTGDSAQSLLASLQSVRDKIEGKVAGKTSRAATASEGIIRRAEESGAQQITGAERLGAQTVQDAESAFEAARAAPRGTPTATAGETGQTVRGVISGRMTAIEDAIKKATEEARLTAFSTEERVGLAPALAQVEKMMLATNRPQILAALKEAKGILNGAVKKSGLDVSQLSPTQIAAMRKSGELVFDKVTGNFIPAKGAQTATVELADDARKGLNDILRQVGKGEFAAKEIKIIQNAIEGNAPQKYRDYLNVERAERTKLDPFSQSSGAGARTSGVIMKDQYGRDFMANPESIGGKYFRSGDEGAAAAREFKTATGADPEAQRVMSAYVAGKLKDTSPEKWGPFLAKHESALREYGLYDFMKAHEQTAVNAKGSLTSAAAQSKEGIAAAKATAKAGMGAAETSAAALTDRAGQTVKNVKRGLSENTLGQLTTDFKSASAPKGTDARRKLEKIFTGGERDRDLKNLVNFTKRDPAQIQNLRNSLGEWITTPNEMTKIPSPTDLVDKWKSVLPEVKSSGLMDAQHIKNVDSLIETIRRADRAGRTGRAAVTVGGFFFGLSVGHPFVGSHFAREIGGIVTKKGMEKRIAELMTSGAIADANMARYLNAPLTPANVERIRVMLPTDVAAALVPTAAREDSKSKPRAPARAGEIAPPPQ